jgi:hypothetical protein
MSNLLSKESKKKYIREYQARLFYYALLFLSVIILFSMVLLVPSFLISVEKEKNIKREHDVFFQKHNISESDSFEKIVIDLINKLSFFDLKEKITFSALIKENIILPDYKGIKINGINYEESAKGVKTLSISGKALNRESLQAFVLSLGNNPSFSSVSFPLEDFVKRNDIDFNIPIILK